MSRAHGHPDHTITAPWHHTLHGTGLYDRTYNRSYHVMQYMLDMIKDWPMCRCTLCMHSPCLLSWHRLAACTHAPMHGTHSHDCHACKPYLLSMLPCALGVHGQLRVAASQWPACIALAIFLPPQDKHWQELIRIIMPTCTMKYSRCIQVYTMPHCALSHHITSHHISMQYRIMSCHVTSRHITLYHDTSQRIMSHHVTS